MSRVNTKKAVPSGEETLCPIRYMMEVFGGKWKMPIICMLAGGTPLRNSAIKRKLGDVTNMMLSQSLKELESAGIIHRKQYNEVPPRVEYSLTDAGRSILPILGEVGGWAANHMQANSACGANCEKCQATV